MIRQLGDVYCEQVNPPIHAADIVEDGGKSVLMNTDIVCIVRGRTMDEVRERVAIIVEALKLVLDK